MESRRAARPAPTKIVPAEGKVKSMAEQAMNQTPNLLVEMKQQRIINDREKFESRFAKLTTELNLSPEQQAKIRAAMEESVKKVGADGM